MTSVDSNVILAALSPHERHHQHARARLKQADEGGLVLSPIVYAELMASTERDALRTFLQRAGWGCCGRCPLPFGSAPEWRLVSMRGPAAPEHCRAASLPTFSLQPMRSITA